jgi:D-apiose dehydrogenase
MPTALKGGIIGCGFFAERHIEAWRRMPEVEIVAAADPQLDRAESFAPRAYHTAEELLDREPGLDFVDIATRTDLHLPLVRLAAQRKVPIICQKPFASNWQEACQIVREAEAAGVRLMVHENWRWQAWYRVAQRMIAHGDIGPPLAYGFHSRVGDGVGDEPYAKQAYFRKLDRMLIDQSLVHHMDTARFLFGEIATVCARAGRRNPQIAGEDWAMLLLTHASPVHGYVDGHRFLEPEPPGPVAGEVFFEGELGTLSIRNTGDIYRNQTLAWKNDVTVGYRGDSVRATQAHFISCLQAGVPFETGGREYLPTYAAVEAAYQSVADGRCVSLAGYTL